MSPKKHTLHDGHKGSALAIRVTPRASRNEIVEILADGSVKVRLTASPAEGQTNQALIDYLAQVLEVPIAKLEIVAGLNGRDKLVSIIDLDAATVQQRILRHLS